MAAKPTPPSQSYSFTDHSINFPTVPQPGDRLDSEFSALQVFAAQVNAWVSTALADDGTIRPGVIGTVTLDPALVQGIVDDVEAAVQPLVSQAEAAQAAALVSQNAAAASSSSASGYASTAQGAASTATGARDTAVTARNDAQGYASNASSYAATATSAASEAEDYRTTALDKRNDAIMFSEYLAGPVWTPEEYAVIDPGELPPGFAYQPVEGLPAGLFSAKWWAVQAMQIVAAMSDDFVPITGGVMTGLLKLSGAPTDPLHAVTKQYADEKVALAGSTMTGALILNTNSPGTALQAASKGYVDTALVAAVGGSYLPLTGGTLTGFLTLHNAPSEALHAATKSYVDAMVQSGGLDPSVYVIKAGDVMGGAFGVLAGAAATPGLFVSGDTNTGLYQPAADTLAATVGGASMFQVRSGYLAGGSGYDGTLPANLAGVLRLAAAGAAGAAFLRHSADASDAQLQLFKSRGASVGTYAAVASGDALGALAFTGDNGSGTANTGAQVQALASQTWAAGAAGAALAFSTTANSTVTLSERMRILNSGNVLIAATSDLDAAHKLQVSGSLLAQGASSNIFSRATGTTGIATVSAQAGDYASGPSYESANLMYYEASSTVQKCGITLADWGVVSFLNTNGGMVYTNVNVPLVFGTSELERMRIVGAGRVLVGTTTDNATDLLQVSGTAAVTAPAAGADNTQVPTTAWVRAYASAAYQPLDADLTAIAALAGTSGFLTKTALNTWALDTSTYALASHNHDATYQALDADLTAIAGLTRAKGALIVGGSSAWAAQTVGANDTLLVADSAQTNGVKWTASPTVTNLKINGHAYFDEVLDNGSSGSAMTIDWQNGNKQKVTLSANCTFTFTAPLGPCEGKLFVVQPSSGGPYTPTLPTMKKLDGTAFSWSTAANAVDIFSWVYDGSSYYGVVAAFS